MRKAPEFTPEYAYEDLERILKESTKKAKSGKLDLEGKLYGIAAGYAMDFVDTSKAIKKPLDLTGRTEDNVFYVLMRICAENNTQKKSTVENRTDMAKKLGSYQLFALVNSMNCEEKMVEIAVQGGIMAAEPKLVICSIKSLDGKTHFFDVYAAAKETIDGLTILDPQKNGGAILFGQLAPFYQKFKEDMMDYLVKS